MHRKWVTGALMVAPSALILTVMMAYPALQTLVFSVSDIKLPTFETRFTGLANFTRATSRSEFGEVIGNTVLWLAGTVGARFLVGFWAALVMNTERRGLKVMLIVALLPWTIPQIVAAHTWRWMFQSDYGMLNAMLHSFGLGHLAHSWLGDSTTALPAVMVASVWSGYPFIMLMLLAGLKGIPEELYDAAEVDGAGTVQQFMNVTLPSIQGVIFIILMLETIWALNTFDLIFVMTGGGPGSATEVLGLFIYRIGFRSFEFGSASAMGVVLLGLALAFLVVYLPFAANARRKG